MAAVEMITIQQGVERQGNNNNESHDNDDVAIMMMVVTIRKMVRMMTTPMTTLCGSTTHLGEMICQPAPAYLCSRSWLQIWILYLRVMVWQINMSLLPPDKFVKILVWQMGRVAHTLTLCDADFLQAQLWRGHLEPTCVQLCNWGPIIGNQSWFKGISDA